MELPTSTLQGLMSLQGLIHLDSRYAQGGRVAKPKRMLLRPHFTSDFVRVSNFGGRKLKIQGGSKRSCPRLASLASVCLSVRWPSCLAAMVMGKERKHSEDARQMPPRSLSTCLGLGILAFCIIFWLVFDRGTRTASTSSSETAPKRDANRVGRPSSHG